MDSVLVVEPSAEEMFKNIRYNLDSRIINNPKFKELFLREISYIYYKTGDKKIFLEVKANNSLVSIKSYNKVVDCRRELVDKNESFIESVFYLFDEDLVFETAQGIIFNKKDLEALGLKTTVNYETKLETNYTQRIFTKEGIEYSSSSYSDSYPLKTLFEDVDLESLVTSSFYYPTFNTYHLPESPIHIAAANIRNTYRNMDSLHIIHSNIGELSRAGYKNVTAMLATTHFQFPELLRADQIFARVNGNKNEDLKFKVLDTTYGRSISEIYEKSKVEFINDIERSLIKKDNPQILESIKSYL